MNKLDESLIGEDTPIVISLNNKMLVEEDWMSFSANMKYIMGRLFGGPYRSGSSVPLKVRGTEQQVGAFLAALQQEKKYLEKYMKYGLDNPMTYKSRYELNSAVRGFERETGITWPFK
jgi:hypothetical protein|tara:strand:+ start:489 stop:842 length:354 start_codon:yes stop_codon:yes gene_type:complete